MMVCNTISEDWTNITFFTLFLTNLKIKFLILSLMEKEIEQSNDIGF